MARLGNRLAIWMNGQFVGTWERGATADTLEYDPAWVDSPAGRPLSLSLPTARGHGRRIIPLRSPAVAAWFQNLIPDNDRILGRIAARYGTASTSAFDLLAAIGRDCAGAVQLLPPDADPGDIRRIEAEPLDEAGIARRLRQATMSGPRADADEEDFRLSIAGAQEKTALLLHEGRWCAPHGATPTTHIFKLPLGLVGNLRADLHQSVELEWLCMEFVRECGLPVAETRIGRFEDQVALVVTRFDRELSPDGHWWMRIPQEDLCQAMGVAPSMKYEADGGPGTHAIMDLLRASVNAEEDRRHFFAAQLLFWILGATDGHAKNFSLRLLPRGEFRMTPLYDVLSTYPIQGRGPGRLDPRRAKMAMAVSGSNRHYRLHDIHRWHWVAMGERMGVPDPPGIVAETIARATTALERVASRLPEDFPAALPEAVDAGVKAALRRIGSEPDVRA